MTTHILRIASLATVLTFAHCLIAQPDVVPTVGFLADHANLIVVGHISSDDPSHLSTSLSLDVVRVLKGNLLPGRVITIQRNPSNCAAELPGGAAYGVWFLNELPNHQFEFSTEPKSQPCGLLGADFEVPQAPPPEEWSYKTSAPPKDKLAFELGWSITAAEGDGPLAFVTNSHLLDDGSREAVLTIYRKFFYSPGLTLHLFGLAGLVRLAYPAALNELEGNISAITSVPLPTSFVIHGERLPIYHGADGSAKPTFEGEIAESLSSIVDPGRYTVRALGRILQSPDASLTIRRAAARALQNIHTDVALPFLASLLEESDPELRADGVGGLACFANGVPVLIGASSMNVNLPNNYKTNDTLHHFAMGDAVQTREDYYLTFWKGWWAQNRAVLLSSHTD